MFERRKHKSFLSTGKAAWCSSEQFWKNRNDMPLTPSQHRAIQGLPLRLCWSQWTNGRQDHKASLLPRSTWILLLQRAKISKQRALSFSMSSFLSFSSAAKIMQYLYLQNLPNRKNLWILEPSVFIREFSTFHIKSPKTALDYPAFPSGRWGISLSCNSSLSETYRSFH